MWQRTEADIRDFSFDQFVDFLFASEVLPNSEDRKLRWYFHTQSTFDSEKVCAYYVQLFRQPSFLLDRFRTGKLTEGFKATQVRSLSCSVKNIIWNTQLPISEREECIRSMLHLFKDIFISDPLSFTASMWWDSFCFDWECGTRRRSRGGEDLSMQDVFFETLREALKIDSAICRGAALHGLEHLRHPGTKEQVEHFLAEHPSLDEQARAYAESIAMSEPLWMRTF
jgi:hypothetical protein